MKFELDHNTVNCLRPSGDGENWKVVASFDACIDVVAPHVSAVLISDEIEELEVWLRERSKLKHELKTENLDRLVLEALPLLLSEAIDLIDNSSSINIDLYQEIRQSLAQIESKLEALSKTQYNKLNNYSAIDDAELLKQHLESIKSRI